MSDYCQGLIFSVSNGKQLDMYGEWYKVKRKRFLFIKEPDFFYRKRLWNKAVIYYEQGITFGDLIRGRGDMT